MAESSDKDREPGADEGVDPLDVHIGKRLKERRVFLGMSQKELGEKLKVSYQQIQKYENAITRVPHSRMFFIARLLDRPLEWFTEKIDEPPARRYGFAEGKQAELESMPTPSPSRNAGERPETTELVRAYYAVEDPAVRRSFLHLLKNAATKPGESRE